MLQPGACQATSNKARSKRLGSVFYRYSSGGAYYAVVRHGGKLIRRSLHTTDRAVAKRKLADFRRDIGRLDAGPGCRVTLRRLCDQYLQTVLNQAPKTNERKQAIVARIKADWPGGADVAVNRVKPSDVAAWLASYDFGWASQNLHLECIRAIFDLAVADKVLVESPARSPTIKRKKKERPLRLTPSFEEFKGIVADLRSQAYSPVYTADLGIGSAVPARPEVSAGAARTE